MLRAPLDVVLRRAGAVLATRDGRSVAINFGSAAAELAVCVRAVGLVDRSELSKLVVEAPPAQLAALTSRLVGDPVVTRGRAVAPATPGGAATRPSRVIVLSDPATGSRLRERMQADAAAVCDHDSADASAELAAIGLLGRGADKVLRALGAFGESGDPRAVAPFAHGSIADIPASWLLQSDCRALALVPSARAGEAWLAIERAGRPFGISCVGHDAACRYALLERTRPAAFPHS